MKDPVADFWGNIEYALDQGGFRYILEDLVSKVRTQLDGSSMTAQSIDRHDSYSGRLQPSRCLASWFTWEPLFQSGGTGVSSLLDIIPFPS